MLSVCNGGGEGYIVKCKLCSSNEVECTYKGPIRDGGLNCYTNCEIEIYKCSQCGVIWHEPLHNSDEYYESEEYRSSVDLSAETQTYYQLHDKECLDKFLYTGTAIFRNKIVADIGCGGGSFLDYLSGVAKRVIGIEPSETFRKTLIEKNYITYDYAEKARKDFEGKVDVVTSFDVIEHVTDPLGFLLDIYALLNEGGHAIIGTPTDAPAMRALLGEVYEKKVLFTAQHIWIFSETSLKSLAEKAGFKNIRVRFVQRYGIDNMLGWLINKAPNSGMLFPFVSRTFDAVWKGQLEEQKYADYVVLYIEK